MDSSGIRSRGVPLVLAESDGRFYEIYLADDDRSYEDALLVGQRVYRRDLLRGDSSIVFEDGVVPRIARAYARAHPGARPLAPDESELEDPSVQATDEIELLGVHGPFVSFEYHADVELPRAEPWHTARRGVIDLRSGRIKRLRELFADSAANRVAREGKQFYRAAVDSVLVARRNADSVDDERRRRAAAIASQFRFDRNSFSLGALDGQPSVDFAAVGTGPDMAGELLPVAPVPGGHPGWWSKVSARFPIAEGDADRWQRPGSGADYGVLAHYDSTGDSARLALTDRSNHEWPLLSVAAPVFQMYWLDGGAVDSAQRRALQKAFDDALLYDERVRTVRSTQRMRTSVIVPVVLRLRPYTRARS